MQKIILGDEAIAKAAIDAGLSGMYAYPGTPSTEIMEYIQSQQKRQKKIFIANGLQMKRLQWRLLWHVLRRQKGNGCHETCRA